MALSLGLFAFSTILGWEYNGEKALEYLTNSTKATFVYRLLYSVVAFVGCISAFEIAWNISDILNALMIIPNVICLIIMSGVTKREMERFQDKRIRSKKIGSF